MRFAANLILFLHFLYVLGIVVPVFLIPIGWKLGWKWVHSRRLRVLHLAMMGFVLFEVLVGIVCPLTILENQLLAADGRPGYQDDFISYWLEKVMYWQLPSWAFMALYGAIFFLILFLWKMYPPRIKLQQAE